MLLIGFEEFIDCADLRKVAVPLQSELSDQIDRSICQPVLFPAGLHPLPRPYDTLDLAALERQHGGCGFVVSVDHLELRP